MNSLACRLLPYAEADGPANMAADEVLLESALAGVASLRFYGWSPATLSLGYFQPEELRRRDPRLAALPFVRRPSGGAALVHHHEVTYALALPPGPPWQDREPQTTSWLCRVHRIIAAALSEVKVAVEAAACPKETRFTGLLCFQHLTPGDLLLEGIKVVGSAQRRHRGALLQHGAILLASSPYAPVLPGIRELSGRDLSVPEVCTALQKAWARDTGWDLLVGDWTDTERRRTTELRNTKYSQPGWNEKR